MEIYLIRHGETPAYNSAFFDADMRAMNPPLNETGVSQANFLRERLKSIDFDALFVSDMLRAVQTADIAFSGRSIKTVYSSNLREIQKGDIVSNSWDVYPKVFDVWSKHIEDTRYPNGENGMDVWLRAKPILDEITSSGLPRTAIVTHGGFIRAVVCGCLNLPQQSRFFFGDPLNNCSVTILKYSDAYSLHSFNIT